MTTEVLSHCTASLIEDQPLFLLHVKKVHNRSSGAPPHQFLALKVAGVSNEPKSRETFRPS